MVAETTGLHESTVSRVTANKYIATPRGTFELKFFFTNAAGGAEGMTAESVRHRIRALVAVEAPGAVLSDERIVERLREDGIEIARRTVVKYRKQLGIGSSAQRRRAGRIGFSG
jgi:RNA polymerase sigma-54 factor